MQKYMKTTVRSVVMLLLLTFFAVTGGTAFAASASKAPTGITYQHACAAATRGHAQCTALVATLAGHSKALTFNPFAIAPGGSAPYGPTQIRTAYNLLPYTGSANQTVAIIDAYSDPNLASDLAVYRSTWGLPACTTASGCLRIVNQTGGTTLPAADYGWGLEESLDVDMVSAICQNCHILVVEANSASFADLGTAANEAVTLGAKQESNSYGAAEFSGEASYCSAYYQHTYVAVTVSTGDTPGTEFPSVCPYVTAVGGTTLPSSGAETPWTSAGGGCSPYIPKPSWETGITGCGNRAAADVSAVADPNTGVYVYDTYVYSGWYEVGGTSASSPIIASVYALAGNAGSTTYPVTLPWARYTTGCLFQVPAGTVYSYQGGLGSPNGIGCF